jgi:hypothetical protein
MLLKLVAQGKLAPERFASHRLTFDSIIDAYDTIGGAAETKALKVVITGRHHARRDGAGSAVADRLAQRVRADQWRLAWGP